MIKDVTNSIKATLYQRVNSPLYGTFIFAWMLYNWEKTLQLTFGSKDFDARLAIFKSSFKNTDTGSSDYWTFLVPMAATIFILFFQPVIQRIVFVHNERNKHKGLNARDEFDNERRLTIEESMAIKDDLSRLHERNQVALKIKEDEKEQLSKQYESQLEISKEITLKYQESGDRYKDLHDENEEIKSSNEQLKNVVSDLKAYQSEILEESDKVVSNFKLEISSLKEKSDEDIKVEKELNNRITQLKEELSNERGRYRNIQESEAWFLNHSFIEDFPKILGDSEGYAVKYKAELFSRLLGVSNDNGWVKSCYELMILGFNKTTSYSLSDDYFSIIIMPYLEFFDIFEVTLLETIMVNNPMINDSELAFKNFEDLYNAKIKFGIKRGAKPLTPIPT